MTDGTGATSYIYDALGRLISTTDGTGHTVAYSYDADGNVTTLTNASSQAVTKTYDGAGNLTSVTDWLGHKTSFSYDGDHNLIAEVTGSSPAVTDTYTYNAADGLISVTDKKNSTVLQAFSYARNANQFVTSVTPSGGATTNYTYNNVNQLTGDKQGTYTYDPAGNVTKFVTSAPLTYNADDQLTSQGKGKNATIYSVDSEGRFMTTLPSGAQSQYYDDLSGRLTEYYSGSASEFYTYNGDGLRTSKTNGQTHLVSRYTWDTTASVPLMLGDGSTSYIYGPGGLPMESIDSSGTISFFHHDQLGSTTMLTSVKGAKTATFTYSSYGKLLSGTAVTPLLYAGQYLDNETGFYYLHARYYDPASGQFMSIDPAVDQTHAPYSYSQGNPVNRVDPTGLFSVLGLIPGYTAVTSLLDANQTCWRDGWTSQACSDAIGHATNEGLLFGISTLAGGPTVNILVNVGVNAATTIIDTPGSAGENAGFGVGGYASVPGCGSVNQSGSIQIQGSTSVVQGSGVQIQ